MAGEGGGSLITWNATNWITVLVMAAGGFLALGLLAKLVAKYRGGTGDVES